MHTEISRSHNTTRGKVYNGISQQGDGPTINSRTACVSFFLCAYRSLFTMTCDYYPPICNDTFSNKD